MVAKNFILVGANSELATTFADKLNKNNHKVYGVSRDFIPYLNKNEQLQLKNYNNKLTELIDFVEMIQSPYIVFFNGYLAENRPAYFPSYKEIEETIYANYLTPLRLFDQISRNNTVKKFIFISSMAAVKPRNKNYIYGLSKKSLEEAIRKSGKLNYLIVRFGQVKTKMSQNHNEPPFTLTKDQASLKLIKLIDKKGLHYPSYSLFIISILIKILPIKLIDKLEK